MKITKIALKFILFTEMASPKPRKFDSLTSTKYWISSFSIVGSSPNFDMN